MVKVIGDTTELYSSVAIIALKDPPDEVKESRSKEMSPSHIGKVTMPHSGIERDLVPDICDDEAFTA
jgi:hypothetical protein